jgi:NodT family efflux transporter outer membrane factor (OMF) lipoprotein
VPTNHALARIAACLLLTGCTVGPNFERPTAWWQPSSWGHATPAEHAAPSQPVAEAIDPQWWKLLGDPLLTALETRLDRGNFDLRIATIRLAEARATYGVAESALYPTLGGSALYERQQVSKLGELSLAQPPGGAAAGAGGAPNTGIFHPFDLYQPGFDASWELDLWGGVRRRMESSLAQVQASEEQQRDTLVTESAELARDYVQLRGAQRKLDITRENLASQQQTLKLTREQTAAGLTSELDVANADAEVENTAAQIPPQEQNVAELINAISLLLGQPPRALQAELSIPGAVPPVPPRVPVGLPSELARRRPDIRRAEALLHSTTADIGVATADFYPTITLSGSAALQTLQLSKLAGWQGLTYAFGPTLSLPIFQGGRLIRTLELRRADQQEAALAYQQTVLAALHDVDNALTAYETEQHRRDRLAAAVAQNQRALSLAQTRYQQGVADFLEVLIAQRSLLAAEQDLTDSTTTVSTNLVQLYKALGGGWQTDLPEAQPQKPEQQAKS